MKTAAPPQGPANWTDNSGYSHIQLYPNGEYKSFVPVTETDWLVGNIPVTLQADCEVSFYESGHIQGCQLSKSAKLIAFGISVIVSPTKRIEFHENGNVRTLKLGYQPSWIPWVKKSWLYRGKLYSPGSALQFDPEGNVISVKS